MKVAPALALALLLAPLAAGAAPPDSIAAAQKTLDAARADLAGLVKKIEKDPPEDADLEAANAAVDALKDAIDSGAAHEANDLDYARAVLAARKELRTHREYVEQRRANVHIHKRRRTIDAALATLNDRARRTEAKTASAKDFEDARAAAGSLKKVVEDGRQFTKSDPKFASYITEVDATVARLEKAFDDRSVAQTAEKHRGLVEESRKALAAALAPLDKSSTDAMFAEADKAVAELSKRLEEGKPLEGKDKAYSASAEKAHRELAQAKKKMDEAFTATGLARLKAEIEPAHKDLITAGKGVRTRKATDDQLAEARTAAIVVRKLLEKFQADGTRSQALGQYMSGVRKTLVEVEVELQRRTLDAARADVTQAMKQIVGKAPTDEQFQEATTALTVLEKTLEAVHAKDPAMAPHANQAQAQLRDSKATIARRRAELESELNRRGLDAARKDVLQSMKQVGGRAPTEEQFKEAESALGILEKTLEGVKTKDPAIAAHVNDAKTLLRDSKATVARRRVELEVELARKSLDTAKRDVNQALKAIGGRAPTEEHFGLAESALGVLEKTVEGVKVKDPALTPHLTDARNLLRDAKAAVTRRRGELEVEASRKSLDTAKKDVNQALKPIGGRAPTDEHFAEAESAVGVLEKTVEGVKSRDPALAAHLTDARNLVRDAKAAIARRRGELDVDSQRKSVEAAKKEVLQAFKQIGGKAPTDEHFDEATGALGILEKTIEAVKSKDPAIGLPAAKALLKDSKAVLARRRIEVDVMRQQAKVEEARKKAAELMRQIQQASATKEQVDGAEAAVKQIGTVLAEGEALIKRDRGYGGYDREVKARIKELHAAIAARRIALAGAAGKGVLTEGFTDAKAKVDTAKQPDSTDAHIADAVKAVAALGKAIEDQTPLEKQDKAYFAQAEKAREQHWRLTEGLELAKAIRELRRETVEALAVGVAAAAAGGAAEKLRAQKDQYEKAIAQFKSCGSTGASMINNSRPLETAALFVDGQKTAAKDVIALCVEKAAATEVLLKQVVPLIAFDEGPKKTFEAGKSLLARSRKPEALKQFDECISSGLILQNRSPEMKERKFQVAGGEMTLAEVIQQCIGQRKALKGK